MIGNHMSALAFSTAFAILCFAQPAIAAHFDGSWNMVAAIAEESQLAWE